jgi:hypothetical protein
MNLESICEDANEKHLQPWSEICKSGKIENTPLTPYLDRELLKDNELSMKGEKLAAMGFTYSKPEMTEALLKEVITGFVEQNLWPLGTTD